jgi:uncharacterized protein YkwD
MLQTVAASGKDSTSAPRGGTPDRIQAAGRHASPPRAARRTLLVVGLLCMSALALAVGCRSAIVDQLTPEDAAQAAVPVGSAGGSPADGAVSTTALPTPPASTPGPGSSPSPTPGPTTSTKTTPPRPQPTGLPGVAQQLLDQINAWRADAGQPPLVMASGLVASAHKHNLTMSAGCGLKHQCSGESGLGTRISAEGVTWRAVAENIGWSSRAANTTSAILAAASGLNTSMHNETPPDDGHRRNMLSASYHRIGIDVIRDASGQVWLTQDFAN